MLPEEISSCSLWWAGPSWLTSTSNSWPTSLTPTLLSDGKVEERKIVLVAHIIDSFVIDLLNKHSSLRKVQRILAYILRFIHKPSSTVTRSTGHLSLSELHKALLLITKIIQSLSFPDIIDKIIRKELLPKSIRKLNPFVDEEGYLRVCGRLHHSHLSVDQKNPLLLPGNHRFTNPLIECLHRENLHTGYQTLYFLISQTFWILSAKRRIRSVLSKCRMCFCVNPKPLQPMMGDLPQFRVS